ncbi:MAG TPA: hypothetical protein VFP69_12045 [Streptomyces sp.]|nr:hypothetical protein [Streptomyces sp.]
MRGTAASVTERYRQRCEDPHGGLRDVMARLPLPPAMRASSGHRLLPRPLFVEESALLGFAADATALFELLVAMPGRLFGGDLDRYCEAIGMDAAHAALNRSAGGGAPPLYGRADMYHDGTAFRLLEFNIASELGGVDRAGELPALLNTCEAFAAFAQEEKLGWVHTGHEVARTLRDAGRAVSGGREPVVALLEGPGGMEAYGDDWRAFREMTRAAGLDLRLGEIGDITVHDGTVLLDGVRVDVVLRTFSVDEVLGDERAMALVGPLVRAHLDGRVLLWTTMESNLFNPKSALALLHEPRTRSLLSVPEAALVDRVVPWTRTLRAGDAETAERCRREREHLVLKPPAGYGGSGVVAGWECEPADWERAVELGLAQGHVVQQRVVPRDEPVLDPDTGAVAPWHAAWGLFLTPSGYAGSYARLVPAGSRAVIGVEAPGARIAAVFSTPG